MLLHFQDTADLLSAIIVLCFSFCILVTTYWAKHAEVLQKLLGYSLIAVFLFNFTALLVYNPELSDSFSLSANPMLLLLITLLLAAKPGKNKYKLFCFILILLPSLLLLTAVFSLYIRSFLVHQLYSLFATVVISAVALYLLQKEKGNNRLLIWFILPLLASSFAQLYLAFEISAFVTPLLQLYAYAKLLIFFFTIFHKSQLDKIAVVEKKQAAMNRTIDYEVKKRMLEVEKVNQNLIKISKIDSMSKTMNKTALLDSIDYLICRKPKSKFSILMLDIDDFKTINDTLGHIIGDNCIKIMVANARNNMRNFDLIGRYGGDEFVIVLPDTDIYQAFNIAERFRRHMETTDSPHYTISIGIASYPLDGNNVKTLITAADEGLYNSKRKGRNAVSHKDL